MDLSVRRVMSEDVATVTWTLLRAQWCNVHCTLHTVHSQTWIRPQLQIVLYPFRMHQNGHTMCMKNSKLQPPRNSWKRSMFLYFLFIFWPQQALFLRFWEFTVFVATVQYSIHVNFLNGHLYSMMVTHPSAISMAQVRFLKIIQFGHMHGWVELIQTTVHTFLWFSKAVT